MNHRLVEIIKTQNKNKEIIISEVKAKTNKEIIEIIDKDK
jgi:hypothetical protein